MGELVQLTSFGLTEGEVLGALGRVKVRDVDYADLYFESCVSESVSMEESLVKRAAKSVSQGVGVRATAGEKTGFAYSDELTKKDLELAADTARYIANSPAQRRVAVAHGPPVARFKNVTLRRKFLNSGPGVNLELLTAAGAAPEGSFRRRVSVSGRP